MQNYACAIVTHSHHTDIALRIYSNRILLIATHVKKFGSLIAISQGPALLPFNNSVYSTKILFGKDDIEVVAAARYIAAQINADKPLLISLSLKHYDKDTFNAIVAAIKKFEAW